MIEVYTGLPGSGKSLHSVKKIRSYLRRGRYVFCNFPINEDSVTSDQFDHFMYRSNDALSPEEFVSFSKEHFSGTRIKEDSILILIDEAQLVFNSRNWNDSKRMDWLLFFSQHRHFGYHVILVAQDSQMIDKQFRSLIEYESQHTKMENFGTVGFFLTFFGLIPLFREKRFMFQNNIRVETNWFFASKRLYSLYDSYRLFGDD